MQTIHISADDSVVRKILRFVQELSESGENIELLDEELIAYEKRLIDRALFEAAQGHIISLKDLKQELGI